MVQPILMPKPGQMTEECTLILWLKAEGEPVRKGDVLFEIETDKSAMEVEAFDEGVLLKQLVPAGATVAVNTVCGYVGVAGEAVPEPLAAVVEPAAPTEPVAPVGVSAPPAEPDATQACRQSVPAPSDRTRVSPRASRLAASLGIDVGSIEGTGPQGRITERDVQAVAARQAVAAPQPGPATPLTEGAHTTLATPLTADAEPMSAMRRVIADRLTRSWTTTPHFAVTVSVNLGRLLTMRQELKATGVALSVTDFILAATAQTLVEFPAVNARTDGTAIVHHPRVHLGLAVSIPGGLVVPVIRDADILSVGDIHDRAAQLIDQARSGSLAVDDMTGSTFTVSNLGMFEVDEFKAIINPGEGAILAVASAVPTPIAIGDGIAVRPMMKLTLSADHRVIDGEVGARFLGSLRRRLEAADSLRNQALTAYAGQLIWQEANLDIDPRPA
ncbi:MAG: 2-oxo acid dehydrogenase subunit E2 [Chloroflexi bacterium]|nr:2-oxo acid dehydrogenase subunit E2 [Chloroflexota bacterium]MBA3586010.1 2-oxo acid dehydrogenase subunit E2 [Chloroflexota bacterium]